VRKACILGAGAWGTALGVVLADRGFSVALWVRNENAAREARETHSSPRLAGVVVPENVVFTSDLSEAVAGAEVVVSAIPSRAVRAVIHDVARLVPPDAVLVSGTKGFDGATLQRPSELWSQARPDLKRRIAVLSGPNFAIEVAQRLPAATVVASGDKECAERAREAFMTQYFRVYTHWDITGVELGGALKNIIALACGMVEGMGLGHNAQAGIISRGIAEITRLGVALGADPLTFAGLSGLGDVVLSSTSNLSRNRQAGAAVGRGENLQEFLLRTGYTVEGVETVKAAKALSRRHGVRMPINDVLYSILYEGIPVSEGLYLIMAREKREESEFSLSPWQG